MCACGCGELTPVWQRNDFAKGRRKGEHARYVPGHQWRNRRTPASQRFWRKVDVATPDACWIWRGYVMPNGYGQFRDGRIVLAHRFAYEDVVGPIPDGLQIDHLCKTTACVNPSHMGPVTQAVNLARSEHRNQYTKETSK